MAASSVQYIEYLEYCDWQDYYYNRGQILTPQYPPYYNGPVPVTMENSMEEPIMERHSHILHFIIHNPTYPVTVNIMHTISRPYGEVVRIIINRQTSRLQAMVEFESVEAAVAACTGLQGADIYSGCCTLEIKFAQYARLHVTENDPDAWDCALPYCGPPIRKENLPHESSSQTRHAVPFVNSTGASQKYARDQPITGPQLIYLVQKTVLTKKEVECLMNVLSTKHNKISATADKKDTLNSSSSSAHELATKPSVGGRDPLIAGSARDQLMAVSASDHQLASKPTSAGAQNQKTQKEAANVTVKKQPEKLEKTAVLTQDKNTTPGNSVKAVAASAAEKGVTTAVAAGSTTGKDVPTAAAAGSTNDKNRMSEMEAILLKTEAISLRNQLHQAQAAHYQESQQLKSDTLALRHQVQVLQTQHYQDVQRLNAEILSLQSQLQSVQSQLQSVQTELQSAQSQLQSAQSQLQSAQSQLQSAQSQLQSTQVQEVDKLKAEVTKLQGQLQQSQSQNSLETSSLQKKIKELELEKVAASKHLAEENKILRQSINLKLSETMKLKEKLKQLEQEVNKIASSLQVSESTKKVQEAKIRIYEDKLRKMEDPQDSKMIIKNLNLKIAENMQLRNQIKRLEIELSKAGSKAVEVPRRSQSDVESDSAENSTDMLESSQQIARNLQDELRQKTTENKRLKWKLKSSEIELSKAASACNSLEAAKKHLEARLSLCEEKFHKLQYTQCNKIVQQSLAEKVFENKKMKEKLKQQEEEVDKTLNALRDMEDENKGLQTELKEVQDHLKQVRDENNNLQAELKACQDKVKQCQASSQDVIDLTHRETEELTQELSRQVEQFSLELKMSEAKNISLMADLEKATTAHRSGQEQIQLLLNKLQEFEVRIAKQEVDPEVDTGDREGSKKQQPPATEGSERLQQRTAATEPTQGGAVQRSKADLEQQLLLLTQRLHECESNIAELREETRQAVVVRVDNPTPNTEDPQAQTSQDPDTPKSFQLVLKKVVQEDISISRTRSFSWSPCGNLSGSEGEEQEHSTDHCYKVETYEPCEGDYNCLISTRVEFKQESQNKKRRHNDEIAN